MVNMIVKRMIKIFNISFIFTIFINLSFLIVDALKKNIDIYKSEFKIAVFLKKNEELKDVVYEKLRNIPQIKDIKYFSKEDIRNLMMEYENEVKILDNINPFPETFILNTLEYRVTELKKIKNRIYEIDGVDEVSYDEEIPDIIMTHTSFLNIVKCCIVFVILLISVFFIIIVYLNFRNMNFEILRNRDLYKFILVGQAGLISGIIFLEIIIMRLVDLSVNYSMPLKFQNIFVISVLVLFFSLIEFFEVQKR